jgi:hypothetical protein
MRACVDSWFALVMINLVAQYEQPRLTTVRWRHCLNVFTLANLLHQLYGHELFPDQYDHTPQRVVLSTFVVQLYTIRSLTFSRLCHNELQRQTTATASNR